MSQMLVGQIEGRLGRLGGGQGIDYDPPGFSPDQGHMSQIKGTDLIDSVHHFKETVMQGIELGLTPEAGVDGGGASPERKERFDRS